MWVCILIPLEIISFNIMYMSTYIYCAVCALAVGFKFGFSFHFNKYCGSLKKSVYSVYSLARICEEHTIKLSFTNDIL